MKKIIVSAFAATMILGSISPAVQAEGFLAGLAKRAGLINEKQRKDLDDAHKKMGQPLDKALQLVIASQTGK